MPPITYSQYADAARERKQKLGEMRDLLYDAERANRDLSRREAVKYAELERRVDELARITSSYDPRAPGSGFDPRLAAGMGPPMLVDESSTSVLAPEQRMVDWAREHQPAPPDWLSELEDPQRFSLGRAARGIISGRWDGAELERRALSESVLGSGGYLIPSPLGPQVIDRVRNAMRVMQLGAKTVPIPPNFPNYTIARLTAGPSPALAWKTEGNAITASDLSFDRVTFVVQTLPILIKASRELVDDLSSEAAQMLEHEISQAMALELDRVCLRGSGTPPEPKGIRNQSGITTQTLGSGNGASIASAGGWDVLVDAAANIRNLNLEPSGFLWSSRSAQSFGKLKDSQSRYLEPPSLIAAIPRPITNQIPNTLTVGSSADCSEIYGAAWDQLLVGMRTEMVIEATSDTSSGNPAIRVLSERFADNLQVAFLAYIRADVQLQHPEAFNLTVGVRP